MPNEHFCLKWNNFQRNIVAALGNLKLDEDFVDVTISCEGKLIKAHKVILSACSDYFRDLFRENPCQHPVIILRDASYTDVEGLVRYVYRGEVDVQPQHLQSFLKTADALKIKGLADQGLVQDSSTIVKDDAENNIAEDEDDEDEAQEPPSSAFEPYTPPPPPLRIHEPLKVPIPPSSNHFRSSTLSNEDQPEAKRMRTVSPPLVPPLNFLPPSAGGGTEAAAASVPLVKKKPEEESYPPPSQSPLFLQHSPKHIIAKVETVSQDTFLKIDEDQQQISDRKISKGSKKKKLKKEPILESSEEMVDNNNSENNGSHPRNRWRCMQPRLCNYCWKTFSNSFNLKQHIVNVHIQSQGVSCSLCDKVVKNKWYLRKHLVTAHGAPLKRVTSKTKPENGAPNSTENNASSMMMTAAAATAASIAALAMANKNEDQDLNENGNVDEDDNEESTENSKKLDTTSNVNRLSTTC